MTHIELYREMSGINPKYGTRLSVEKDSAGTDLVAINGIVMDPPDDLYVPGDFRWRMVHTNGETIGASTEGYADKRDCIYNLLFVLGGKLDHAGTVLRRRFSVGPGRFQKFEVHDLTKNNDKEK